MSPLKSAITSLLIGFQAIALAQDDMHAVSLRETCRKQIAGKYLNLYDKVEHNSQLVQLYKYKLKQLGKSQLDTKKEYQRLQKEINKQNFNVELATKRDQVQEKLKIITNNIETNKSSLEKTLIILEQAEKDQKLFDSYISKVFVVKKELSPEARGYNFRVDYKTQCSKLYHLCSLPKKESDALRNILPDGPSPIACQRYANFSE